MLVFISVYEWMFLHLFFRLHVIQLRLETNELYETSTQNIEQVQQKADRKSMQLEGKLKDMTDGLEATQAQLLSVLSACNMDRTALHGATNTIEVNFI